jgi:hypothetical protein
MWHRCLALLSLLTVVLAVATLAQGPTGGEGGPSDTWTAPRTPWGEPDLQGVWRYEQTTPLERPKQFGNREFLTDEEVAEREKVEEEQARQLRAGEERPRGENELVPYNSFWKDIGRPRVVSRRTSLIVDPPDGRIPLTAEAQKKRESVAEIAAGRYPRRFFHQSWLDFDTGERCLTNGVQLEWWPNTNTGPNQIVQSPGQVMIVAEQYHDRRVIPTDGRPHGNIRQWRGDSVGRWEGNSLVVETTNFPDTTHYIWGSIWHQTSHTLRLKESWTRISDDTIEYRSTTVDPKTFTKPWSTVVLISKLSEMLFENACHAGNYTVPNVLDTTRKEEKAANKSTVVSRTRGGTNGR